MRKRHTLSLHGFLEIHTLIMIILSVVSFVIAVAVIQPLYSSEFQMSWRERWCQVTVVLNRHIHLTDDISFPLACSTERLVVDTKDFEKAMTDDDTIAEGGARYILDTMRRCKFLVGGENPPLKCPYCGRDGTLTKDVTSSSLLHEIEEEESRFKKF